MNAHIANVDTRDQSSANTLRNKLKTVKMEDSEGPSTPPTPSEYVESENFQLVTRKRKGKKKGKAMTLLHFKQRFQDDHTTTDGQETPIGDADVKTEDQHLIAGGSDIGDMQNSDPQEMYGVPCESYSAEVNDSRLSFSTSVTLDGRMKNPPQIMVPEELPPMTKEKELEIEFQGNVEEKLEYQGPREEILEIINKRALPKHATTYQLETFEKNALLVFNQTNIEGYSKPRLGTEKDVAELERTFKGYGFEVQIEEDLTKQEIMTKLKECKYLSIM